MKVGRNDPCPCGSGTKYKKCCMALDRIAGRAGPQDFTAGKLREATRYAVEWQADLFAMPASFENEPDARPGALLVTADGFLVGYDVLGRPSPEPEEMAAELARVLAVAAAQMRRWPERVSVREPVVAAALGRRLAIEHPSLALPEVVASELADLDRVAFALCEELSGRRRSYFASKPQTWTAWDLPPDLVADLFHAAADFHRGAPWQTLSDADPFAASVPGGGEWTVCVLGQAGKEYGLHLYALEADYQAIQDGDTTEAFAPKGPLIALGFDPGGEIPRPMRKEVTRAGWEIAGPDAYPYLLTINTPAGGVRRRQAEDLLAVLRAVPAFVAARPGTGDGFAGALGWTDPATGIVLALRPQAMRVSFDLPLEVGGAEGPGAEPEAAVPEHRVVGLDELDAAFERQRTVVDRFARHLTEVRGLAERTVRKHCENAEVFVQFLHETGVPTRAVHDYDLRVFLYDWYPRKVWDSVGRTEGLPVSLKRFFDFLEAEEGIVCPWAADVLDDRDAYWQRLESVPGRFFWEKDVGAWRSELNRELAADLLLPEHRLGEDDVWGPAMGIAEAKLQRELHRRWLIWRDELILAGVNDSVEVEAHLAGRQRQWESSPHPAYAGRSPIEVVLQERAERA